MKAKESTLDKIARLTGLRDGNNLPDEERKVVQAETFFDPGGFGRSKMDSDVFDRNPDPWPDNATELDEGEFDMPKNDIEKPQVKSPNANKSTKGVINQALDNRNHGNTKEEK